MAHSLSSSEKDNTIAFQGYLYARLGFAPPSQVKLSGSAESLELPVGWEIAPDDPQIVAEVIGKHHWGIQVLTLSNGNGYNTRAHTGTTPGGMHGTNTSLIKPKNNQYSTNWNGWGVLIRTKESPVWSAESYRAQLMLRLGKSRKFTDCMICCKDRVFAVHRSVLAVASPVFESMLDADMTEGNSQCIKINDAEPDVIKAMLDFVYTGMLKVETEHLAGLMNQADVYQMDALQCASAEHALEIIDVDNAAAIARSMRPLASRPDGKLLFERLLDKLTSDGKLLSAVILGL